MKKGKVRLVTAVLMVFAMILAACSSGKTAAPSGSAAASAPAGSSAPSAAASQAPAAKKAPDKVRFAYFPAFHTMVVFVADKGGFFKEENLDVQMISADRGSLLVQMLAAKQADLSTADITAIALANKEGRNLLHVYPTSQKMSMNFVASNETLQKLNITAQSSLDDKLKSLGKMKIGITGPNSPTDLYTRFLLQKAGIDPEKVTLVNLSNAGNLLAGLKSKQIDGFMLTPPTPNQPVLDGYGSILIKSSAGEVPELAEYPYQGVTVNKEWAQANQDVVVRFVRALQKANEFIKKNPEKAQEHLAAYFDGMDKKAIAAGLNDMIPALPTDGLMTEQGIDKYLKLNKELKILQMDQLPSAKEGDLWTNEYVKKASGK